MTADRAQTTLDFTIGISIFLAVIMFVFAFLPTMFAPFSSDTGSDAARADRIAERLTADALAETPTEPSILDATCTAEFFDAASPVPPDCRYDEDADALASAVGADGLVRLNVTVRNATGIRSLGGTRLTAGETPSSVADPVVAKRVVLLAGERNRLFVRVW